jgi:hypothetical protein
MIRVAAMAWMLAAAIVAGLVLYLASEEAATCAGDPAVRLSCGPPSLAEVVATPLMRAFLWPVWAPLLLFGYLLARHPTRGRAMVAAGAGIIGGVAVPAVITLLAHPDGSPTWDRPALAFGLLLFSPGLLSGLAALELHPPRQHSIPAPVTHYVSLP